MWLLDTKDLHLTHFEDEQLAKLTGESIVSRTWGEDEATYQEVKRANLLTDLKRWARSRSGYVKIQRACEQALRDKIAYIWIDTCCINKDSSAELSEAINSMYRWYENALVCYAYLSDLPAKTTLNATNIHGSRWFSRGWTLQELIAPSEVYFFDREWNIVGNKRAFANLIATEKGIDEGVLIDASRRKDVSVARRFSWASRRQTTRVEDEAYSLLGLFDVNIPMLYGEGRNAFRRLQEEILRQSTDHSIFAWRPRALCSLRDHGLLLAPRVREFEHCQHITWSPDLAADEAFELSNTGLRITLRTRETAEGLVAILNCRDARTQEYVTVTMRKHEATRGSGRMVGELVRGEGEHVTLKQGDGTGDLYAWKEMVVLRAPLFVRFAVQFSLEEGLSIVDSLPRIKTPRAGFPFTYLYSAFSNTFTLGTVLLFCSNPTTDSKSGSTGGEIVDHGQPFSATLSYGQFLRQEQCYKTFHMVFSTGEVSDANYFSTSDPGSKLQASAPSLTAVSAPIGQKDIEVIHLKATATLASGLPVASIFDVEEDCLSGLDPVWTIRVSRIRGYSF